MLLFLFGLSILVEIFTANVLLHHDGRHTGFGASVATAGWLVGQGQPTKRCTPVKARHFAQLFWEDVIIANQRRKTSATPIDGGFVNLQVWILPKKSVLNFMFENSEWVGELRSDWGLLPLSCWSTSTNRNCAISLDVPTWMKMTSTLHMFVPKWKQMGSILNWISTGSVFSSDVIMS